VTSPPPRAAPLPAYDEPLPEWDAGVPPQNVHVAVARLRERAARLSGAHFDALRLELSGVLHELVLGLGALPCGRRPGAAAALARARAASAAFDGSGPLHRLAPARAALVASVEVLEACGGPRAALWLPPARAAVEALDRDGTLELEHAPLQDAVRTVVSALAATAGPPQGVTLTPAPPRARRE